MRMMRAWPICVVLAIASAAACEASQRRTADGGREVDVQVKVPEIEAPKLKTPEIKAPDVKVPEVDAPDLDLPKVSLPQADRGVRPGGKPGMDMRRDSQRAGKPRMDLRPR